jgi:Domain of unknown function (DUF4129)
VAGEILSRGPLDPPSLALLFAGTGAVAAVSVVPAVPGLRERERVSVRGRAGERPQAGPSKRATSPWLGAAATVLGLAAAGALIAAASARRLGHAAAIEASAARTPATALFVLTLGAGVVALAGLAAAVLPGLRRRDDERRQIREEPSLHWVWKLLAVAMPVALGGALILAGVLGVRAVRPPASGPALRAGSAPPAARAPSAGREHFALPAWLPWTVVAIVCVAALTAAAWYSRRSEDLSAPPGEGPAAQAAVDAGIVALGAAGDARSAVIAAYAAMEQALAARGIRRASAEAPREYLRRVLTAAGGADSDATLLTGLFEEARFSSHPIPERLRELAARALGSLRRRLAASDR